MIGCPHKALGSRRRVASGELAMVAALVVAARGACAPCARWTAPLAWAGRKAIAWAGVLGLNPQCHYGLGPGQSPKE
jgi:hypothetical protein